METDELIRMPEAARRLGITTEAMYTLIIEKVLPYTRENEHRLVFVKASDVDTYRSRTAAQPRPL